ncbi:MAG: PDZ domain-containing protein [Cellvibrio sp.]|uniref:PDZ domain-containing protein n=1 Tax=Cellvibrio sp. TaxID=1965322 RepID=UPI0031AEBA94
MKSFWILPFIFAAQLCAASDAGDFGVEVDVSTAGLFPPKLESAVVATVAPGSSAAEAGVMPGDKIVAIDDCKVPGCSAWTARDKMKKKPGESAEFEIIDSKGESRTIRLTAR